MGHRKHSAPRRGSLAFRPRARVSSMMPTVRYWPPSDSGQPALQGFIGYKAGNAHAITLDYRDRTPNFGKPLFSHCSVVASSPMRFVGVRAYKSGPDGEMAMTDVLATKLPDGLASTLKVNEGEMKERLNWIRRNLNDVSRFTGLVCSVPRDSGLQQKRPMLLEVGVAGGSKGIQLEYLAGLLGGEIRIDQIFKAGMLVDVFGVSKGKGFEGPVTRFGVKRKQHKSRKSVRAVGVLGPWHPAAVTYTVPRAGQMGYHQRLERNKKIILIGEKGSATISPKGGFAHFGEVKGDYLLLRGSVPGPVKRPLIIRAPARAEQPKLQVPQIMSLSTHS